MSSSEIFAALFELELNGKIRQLPGKNFCEELLVVSYQFSVKNGGIVQSFRGLRVWEKSHRLTLDVYSRSKGFLERKHTV